MALISDGLWQRRFGGDPGLVGRTIRLDGRNVAVVGVLPQTFRFPLESPEPQVWLPRVFEPEFLTEAQVRSGASYLSVVGRLREGETISHAQADLDLVDARYARRYGSFVDATRFRLQAESLSESLAGASRRPLMALLAAVGFVLLIVCANVASLQLARASSRAREMAVRKALGATRSRLVGQLLVESLGLSLVGGALGVLLTLWAAPLVARAAASALPRLEEARVDGLVLLFAFVVCCATGLVFGIVPSLYASRGDLRSGLGQGARGSSDGAARKRLRVLFVAETAVALVLVAGAGLLVRSLARLLQVDPGFQAQGVISVPVALPAGRYADPARQADFFGRLLERVRGLPGVGAAGATSYLPLAGAYRFVFFCPEGRACQGIGKDPVIAQSQVSPGYFQAMRTRVVRGRSFDATDTADGPPVVIVNESTARRYWPGADPIGKHLANSRDKVLRQVVGVVADVSLSGLGAPKADEMYLPMAQSPWPTMTVLLRSDSDPRPLAAAVRREIAGLDPDVAISGIREMEDVVSESVAQPKLVAWVVAVFAALALLLASIGIYGVMTYTSASDARVRRADGPGREPAGDPGPGDPGGDGLDAGGRRDGPRGRPGPDEAAGRPALRRRCRRPVDVRDGGLRAHSHGPARVLHPGAPGHAPAADSRPASRVAGRAGLSARRGSGSRGCRAAEKVGMARKHSWARAARPCRCSIASSLSLIGSRKVTSEMA